MVISFKADRRQRPPPAILASVVALGAVDNGALLPGATGIPWESEVGPAANTSKGAL